MVLQALREAGQKTTQRWLFSLFAVAILGLGIGISTALFGSVDAVLFKPLPVDDAATLVRLFSRHVRTSALGPSSYPDYLQYKERIGGFSSIAAYADWLTANISIRNQPPERTSCALVTGNYFQALGVRPLLGRLIEPGDDRPESPAVAVVSHEYWRNRLGSDPAIIGSTITLNQSIFIVIGVLTPQFTGLDLSLQPAIWTPIAFASEVEPTLGREKMNPSTTWLQIVGRRNSDVNLAQLQAQAAPIRLKEQPNDPTVPVVLSATAVSDPAQVRFSWMLFIVLALILTLACSDVAGLLLIRAQRENRSAALKIALGARKIHVALPLLFEAFILSAGGAIAGILIATALAQFVPYLQSIAGYHVQMDSLLSNWRSLAYMLAVVLASTLFVGLVPTLRSTRANPNDLLRGGNAPAYGVPGKRLLLRNGFISLQIAICVVLLILSSLLFRTLRNDLAIDPGFVSSNVLTAAFDPAKDGIPKAASVDVMYQRLETFANIPGIEKAAIGNGLPLQSGMHTSVSAGTLNNISVDLVLVSEEYFKTLGIPLAAGRSFNETDWKGNTMVGVVNEALQKRFWDRQIAVGQVVRNVGPEDRSVEIVGVIKDYRNRGLRLEPSPALFVPVRQFYGSFPFQPKMFLLIRTHLPAQAVFGGIAGASTDSKALHFLAPDSLEHKLESNFRQERVFGSIMVFFGLLALALASSGLYALLTLNCHTRTHEFGIRSALGAPGWKISAIVFSQSAAVLGIGLVVGAACALVLGSFLKHMLYHVQPYDPLTFVVVFVVLGAATMLASYFPARRASKADPMTSLRSE
jgi:putative ABC transport system permease protein